MVKTSIMIKESDARHPDIQEILSDHKGRLQAPEKNLADEIALLKSYPFIFRTMKALNFRVSYFTEDQFQDKEIYEEVPFRVTFVDSTLNQSTTGKRFQVTFLDKNTYNIESEDLDLRQNNPQWTKTNKVGKPIIVNGNALLVEPTPHFSTEHDLKKTYTFVINDWQDLVMSAKYKLMILLPENESSVLDVYMKTSIPQKGIDFLNEFAKQYINYKYETKNRAASQTLDFLDNQLTSIRSALVSSESNLENFKSANGYSEASSMTNRNLETLSQLEEEKAALVVNERYYNSILAYLRENRNLDKLVAPSSIGLQDNVLNSLINQLVELQIEKNTFSADGRSKNPLYQELDLKINNIKNTLRENLNNLLRTNQIRLSQINARSRTYQASISQVPKSERQFVDIKRVYDLNESIYQLLLQKKVEAGIIKASATVENRILEPAFLESSEPVYPKRSNSYALALLLGLALPFSFVWLQGALNNKITSKEDVQSITTIPILGTIFHNTASSPYAITPTARTAISESFRVLRSTINSLSINKAIKVLLVTSTSSGEGKTFNSINIASSLAVARKRTILINLDLRIYSQLHKLMKQDIGMSTYLNGEAAIEDIIFPSDNPFMDYIATGPLPTNPAELIMDDRFPILLNHLRANYDYVIIDSPPMGIVSDPIIVSKYTDFNILVIRQNYTPKEKLADLDQVYIEGKIKNVGIILNDVPVSKDKYQYGYFTEDKKKVKVF
jgi:capsular exopolysaccharide synthesis family protein